MRQLFYPPATPGSRPRLAALVALSFLLILAIAYGCSVPPRAHTSPRQKRQWARYIHAEKQRAVNVEVPGPPYRNLRRSVDMLVDQRRLKAQRRKSVKRNPPKPRPPVGQTFGDRIRARYGIGGRRSPDTLAARALR